MRQDIEDIVGNASLDQIKSVLATNPHIIKETAIGGKTLLHAAASRECKDVAKLLIAAGAGVNARDSSGWTPLHIATWHNHKGMVKLLLAHGANIYAKDKKGITPLYITATEGYEDITSLLMERGGDINDTNYKGYTPLHTVAVTGEGHEDTAKSLIAKGADVNAKNKEGGTPLHLAAMMGDKNMVKLLLASGADHRQETGREERHCAVLLPRILLSCSLPRELTRT